MTEVVKSQKGKSKHRSPNFPSLDLAKALERTKQLYDIATKFQIPESEAHRHWGYKPMTGDGFQIVGALRAYGLISTTGEGLNRKIGVSDLAKRIILDDPKRQELILGAALTPRIFSEVWSHFERSLPPDPVLKSYLNIELGFNPKSVDSFISNFKSTISFANLESASILSGENLVPPLGEEPKDVIPPPPIPKGKPISRTQKMEELSNRQELQEMRVPLSGGEAVLYTPSQMDVDDFEILGEYLESFKKVLLRRSKKAIELPSQNEE